MTERKFTRNLKSRGMAQQLRESVSKVIQMDLQNASVLEHQLETEFQSHRDLIDTFLGVRGFNQNKRTQSAQIHLIRRTGQQQNEKFLLRQDGTTAKEGIEGERGRTDWDSGQLSDEVFWSLAVRSRFVGEEFIGFRVFGSLRRLNAD